MTGRPSPADRSTRTARAASPSCTPRRSAVRPADPPDRATFFAAVFLALLVVGVYLPVTGHGFVHWDDDVYVFENPRVLAGLSPESIGWAFSGFHESTWQPLTWLSYLVDTTLFGQGPRGYHTVNLALHALGSILLLLCLRRLLRREAAGAALLVPCFFAASLFAIHPLNVEPVAWVASRKDLLAANFWFLTIFFYARAVERPSSARWVAVYAAFAAGLMSKPVVMTLPLILLLLDAWPLRRPESWWRRIKEKTPLFGASLLSLGLTYAAQRTGGAVGAIEENSLWERLTYSSTAYLLYLRDAVWPFRLAAFYPRNPVPAISVIVSMLTLAFLSLLILRRRPRWPHLATGWLWYAVALLPMSGLIPFGSHARADRFTYIPMIGLFLALAWSLRILLGRAVVRGAAVVAILAFAVLAHRQARSWRDDETLFRHALAVTNGNYLAHMKLGAALAYARRPDEALVQFEEVVRLRPRYLDGWYNLGAGLDALKRRQDSIEAYEKGLKLKPGDERLNAGLARTWNNAGVDAAEAGRYAAAERCFQQALGADPSNASARTNLDRARAALNSPAPAGRTPDSPGASDRRP